MFKTNCKITIEKPTDEEIEYENKINDYYNRYADSRLVHSIIDFMIHDGEMVILICPLCNSYSIGIENDRDNIYLLWCYDCGASHDMECIYDWLVDISDEEIIKLVENIDVSKN